MRRELIDKNFNQISSRQWKAKNVAETKISDLISQVVAIFKNFGGKKKFVENEITPLHEKVIREKKFEWLFKVGAEIVFGDG